MVEKTIINKIFKCARCPVMIKPGDVRVKKQRFTYCETCAMDIETAPEKGKTNDVP